MDSSNQQPTNQEPIINSLNLPKINNFETFFLPMGKFIKSLSEQNKEEITLDLIHGFIMLLYWDNIERFYERLRSFLIIYFQSTLKKIIIIGGKNDFLLSIIDMLDIFDNKIDIMICSKKIISLGNLIFPDNLNSLYLKCSNLQNIYNLSSNKNNKTILYIDSKKINIFDNIKNIIIKSKEKINHKKAGAKNNLIF